MFKVKGIDHLNMNVKSFKESKEFYSKYFGMEVLESDISKMTNNPYLIIGIPGVISLCLYERGNFDKENDSNQRVSHFGINIENFDEVQSALEADGIPLLYGGVTKWDHSKSIYIADPSGHEIELTKNFGGGF